MSYAELKKMGVVHAVGEALPAEGGLLRRALETNVVRELYFGVFVKFFASERNRKQTGKFF